MSIQPCTISHKARLHKLCLRFTRIQYFQGKRARDSYGQQGFNLTCLQEWEVQQIDEEEEGLIIFDGGTFSRGPHWLVDPDPEDLEEGTVDRDEAMQQAEQVRLIDSSAPSDF